MTSDQEHIFISYAWEDIAFVEWLTFKLTSLGYKIWCDRIKIFGGEPYPKDIDEAIKKRTFRFLAVMSRFSIEKPNPSKERTLAHSISKDRKINFIIPLNLGLESTEIDWMTSDLSYVDFSYNWADGLAQLLKALEKAKAPCTFKEGRKYFENSMISNEILKNEPEVIYSNFIKIKKIPEAISFIRFNRELSNVQYEQLKQIWACRRFNSKTFISFDLPPNDYTYNVENAYLWKNKDTIQGINSKNLVSELIRKSLLVISVKKGLKWSNDHFWLYFPYDSKSTNRISFVDSNGKNNNIQIGGERTFFSYRNGKPVKEKYIYCISPTFKVFNNMLGEEFIVKLGIRIMILSSSSTSFDAVSANSRRKHVTKDWWNYQWVNRYLAICDFLSDRNSEIILGKQEQYKIIFESRPVRYTSSISIDEEKIKERAQIRKSITAYGEY